MAKVGNKISHLNFFQVRSLWRNFFKSDLYGEIFLSLISMAKVGKKFHLYGESWKIFSSLRRKLENNFISDFFFKSDVYGET